MTNAEKGKNQPKRSEIAEAVRELADSAVKKADVTCRAARLRVAAGRLYRRLNRQYRELGIAVYRLCRHDVGDAEEIAAKTVQIDETIHRLKTVEQRINEVLGLISCPVCGSLNKIKDPCCTNCGTLLAVTDSETEENETDYNTF